MNEVVGKTIETIEKEMYGMWVDIVFTDGTKLRLKSGHSRAHNDSWSTVIPEYMEDNK